MIRDTLIQYAIWLVDLHAYINGVNETKPCVLQFHTSLLARRFPGLCDMSVEDIAPLLLLDRKTNLRRDAYMQKSYPKTHFKPGEKQKTDENTPEKKPFVYINPYQAKKGIVPKPEEVVTVFTQGLTFPWLIQEHLSFGSA